MPRRIAMRSTESRESFVTETSSAARSSESLSGMLLPELKAMAAKLGIAGTSGMRKGDIVAAISAHQGAAASSNGRPRRESARRSVDQDQAQQESSNEQPESGAKSRTGADTDRSDRSDRGDRGDRGGG